MQLTAQELYSKLVNDYKIIGEKGIINFTLKNLTIDVETKDTVGNLLQEWLKAWLIQYDVVFAENTNSQKFPDFFLNVDNSKVGLLEVKTFDWDRGPGFDLANFDSYCNSLLEDAYRLDSDYLIFAYQMNGSELIIKDVWLKKIWELSCPSSTYPIKVQEKKSIIYNLRPATWYSERSTFKPFETIEDFLKALNETRYQYPQTRHTNGHWLRNVLNIGVLNWTFRKYHFACKQLPKLLQRALQRVLLRYFPINRMLRFLLRVSRTIRDNQTNASLHARITSANRLFLALLTSKHPWLLAWGLYRTDSIILLNSKLNFPVTIL